jgi:hypothetical protein
MKNKKSIVDIYLKPFLVHIISRHSYTIALWQKLCTHSVQFFIASPTVVSPNECLGCSVPWQRFPSTMRPLDDASCARCAVECRLYRDDLTQTDKYFQAVQGRVTSVRDATSKGHIVHGTHRRRDVSSKGRIIHGTHRPRDALFNGRNIWDFSFRDRSSWHHSQPWHLLQSV